LTYATGSDMNINECIQLAPNDFEYLHAKEIIEEYKMKYHVS
jgi:hypothetical protein